jgi:hypothetical protein
MAKKTGYDIEREERLTRPPRLQGEAKNARTKNKKKKKRG